MTKDKFLKAAKLIVVAWLVFMIVDTTAFLINAFTLTEESGAFMKYVEDFLAAVDKETVELDDMLTLTQFKNNQVNGRILLTFTRMLTLIPWYLSYKTIKNNKSNQFSFLFLMMASSLTLAINYSTLVNFPRPETEGLQTWITYLARAANYPVALVTLIWSTWWLNSKLRIKLTRPAKNIQEQKNKFKAM